jgi:oligopeptidase B
MPPQTTAPPPIARKVPKKLVTHGEARIDDYFWIRDRSNPGVIEYIEAENRYTNDVMKPTEQLQKDLFKELVGRTKQTDMTVPDKIDNFYYYSRTEDGKQYPIYCRKKDSLEAKEEIILDVNKVSEGNSFFYVEQCKASPNHKLLLYLADMNGSERNTLFIKDLMTGVLMEDRIRDVHTAEWANDNKTIFYSTMDVDNRPFKVFRHVIGADPLKDVEVYHEKDQAYYYMRLWKSKTKEYLFVHGESATTSEVHYLKADHPSEPFRMMRPRKHGVIYGVIHHSDSFYIVTNDDAKNFKIMRAPVSDPGEWKMVVPHRENVCIAISNPYPWVDINRDFMVLFERENAMSRIRIINLKDQSSHFIELPEKLYHIVPVETYDFESDVIRFQFSSMVTPPRVYDYDMRKRTLELRKQEEVPGYDPSLYSSERIYARAKDGVLVPISLVFKKGLKMTGKNPGYLYAYGAYGDFEGPAPEFEMKFLPLLDRGFVCAKAHIRGGGDLCKRWHEEGRMLKKINSFTDFIACAEHLIEEGYTSSDRLVIRGKSAGGLLMGAVTTMRPEIFKVVVAEVPFVDVINTMLDPSIPLTIPEFEEWGNPEDKEYYEYFKLYSPYDNVRKRNYPNLLVTGALNDSRVQYWEPAKWVAKLRANKTDDNTILLRTNIVEGHSGASGRYDYLKWFAFMYAFIFDKLGLKG